MSNTRINKVQPKTNHKFKPSGLQLKLQTQTHKTTDTSCKTTTCAFKNQTSLTSNLDNLPEEGGRTGVRNVMFKFSYICYKMDKIHKKKTVSLRHIVITYSITCYFTINFSLKYMPHSLPISSTCSQCRTNHKATHYTQLCSNFLPFRPKQMHQQQKTTSRIFLSHRFN